MHGAIIVFILVYGSVLNGASGS